MSWCICGGQRTSLNELVPPCDFWDSTQESKADGDTSISCIIASRKSFLSGPSFHVEAPHISFTGPCDSHHPPSSLCLLGLCMGSCQEMGQREESAQGPQDSIARRSRSLVAETGQLD